MNKDEEYNEKINKYYERIAEIKKSKIKPFSINLILSMITLCYGILSLILFFKYILGAGINISSIFSVITIALADIPILIFSITNILLSSICISSNTKSISIASIILLILNTILLILSLIFIIFLLCTLLT